MLFFKEVFICEMTRNNSNIMAQLAPSSLAPKSKKYSVYINIPAKYHECFYYQGYPRQNQNGS